MAAVCHAESDMRSRELREGRRHQKGMHYEDRLYKSALYWTLELNDRLSTRVVNKMTTKDLVVQIVPRWADIDLNQHMRHSAFADWAAYARTEWLNAHGFTMPKLVELSMTPVMFEDRTRYLKEVRLGERVHIELQLAGADREGSQWFVRHIFRRGETVCAVYEAKVAWFSVATPF